MPEKGLNLSDFIHLTRRTKGMTILELSAKSGVNRNTISAIEGGKWKSTRFETLMAICRALEIDIKFTPGGPERAIIEKD